jgi:hypothetical protein
MSHQASGQDPLDFLKNMWSSMGFNLPGMVTPTLDVNEIDKRIADLKAVEGWLRMNLNMLHMSIQGLEMQRHTLAAMQAMGQPAAPGEDAPVNPFANPALWPWNFLQQATAAAAAPPPAPQDPPPAPEPPPPK